MMIFLYRMTGPTHNMCEAASNKGSWPNVSALTIATSEGITVATDACFDLRSLPPAGSLYLSVTFGSLEKALTSVSMRRIFYQTSQTCSNSEVNVIGACDRA